MRRGWWRRFDTLAARLFALMWLALVASTVLGYGAGRWVSTTRSDAPPLLLPPLPSLPPPWFAGPSRDEGPPGGTAVEGRRPPTGSPPDADEPMLVLRPGPAASPPMGAPPGISARSWWTDMGVRLVAVALFAALGARWLARPMRELASVAGKLGDSFARGEPAPRVDADRGSLEMRRTADVFNDMTGRLQAQFDQRSLYMAALSHDLRTPMTRLRLRLESRRRDDPGVERSIADLDAMDELIDGVLAALRAERAPETLQPTDLLALAQAVADDLSENGPQVAVEGDAVVALAAPHALERVVQNLVNNALRHAGSARLQVGRAGDEAWLQIDDDGPGIPAAQLDAVCRPWVQLPAADTSPPAGGGERASPASTTGVGLGLYIARELTLGQGGRFALENRAGGGLRASVTLPMARAGA